MIILNKTKVINCFEKLRTIIKLSIFLRKLRRKNTKQIDLLIKEVGFTIFIVKPNPLIFSDIVKGVIVLSLHRKFIKYLYKAMESSKLSHSNILPVYLIR